MVLKETNSKDKKSREEFSENSNDEIH